MTNINVPSPNESEFTAEDKALEDAIGDYLENETDEQLAAREKTSIPEEAVPLEVLDKQAGDEIQAREEREIAESIMQDKLPADEKEIVRELKADHYDVTLSADRRSSYEKARDAQQMRAWLANQPQQPAQAPAQAPRPAVVDPDAEFARQQQLASYRERQAQDAMQAVAEQDREQWMQKAMQFPPEAYMQRALELEQMAEAEAYDPDEARRLLREAQGMRRCGELVWQRHQQVGARLAFNQDAEQVILQNKDLFDVSKGRGKAMLELFDLFPQLAESPQGASIALKVINWAMKSRREGQ